MGKPLANALLNRAGANTPVGVGHLQAAAHIAGTESGEFPLGAPIAEV